MKKAVSIIIITLMTLGATKAQSWPWAKRQVGGSTLGAYEGWAVSTDASGNVFATGFDIATVVFGTYTVNPGMFIVKFNPSGNELWAQGAINSEGIAVKTDTPGNVYVTGDFVGPTITFGTYSLTNSGAADVFLTKYDPNGNVLWARSAGNIGQDFGRAVSTDASGNVFLAGYFNSSFITFGTYTVTNSGAAGTNDIFLTKFDANGNVLWAKDIGDIGDERGSGLCHDASGNVILTGFYKSPVLTLGTYTLGNTGGQDLLLAKYDTNGNILWVSSCSGSNDDEGRSVSESGGNIFVTGSFNSPSVSFGTYTLTNSGSYDVFVTKYDSNGNVLWAKKSGGTAVEFGLSISAYAGDIFVTAGTTSNTFTTGTYTFTAPTGSVDPMVLIQYDLSGNIIYAGEFTSGGDDMVAVALDKFCNAYIVGDFYSVPFVLGTNTLSPIMGCSPGCETIFVAKFSFNCQPDGMVSLSKDNYSVSIYPNPNYGSFKLQIEEEIENGELVLFNSLGQKVHEQKIFQEQNNIITSGLATGLYHYIVLLDKRQISNGKLMVE